MNSHTKPSQDMVSDSGALNSVPVMEIPVIDLGLLGLASTSASELEKLRSALSIWGCFQAINHGIAPEFLNLVREITRQFFQLPLEEKQKYLREGRDPDGLVLSGEQSIDRNDKLFLAVYPEEQRKLKYWPENPATFRTVLHEYTMKLQPITKDILKAMARSLNLEDNCFLDQLGDGRALYARCNFYPPCPRPDAVVGFRPHTDGTAITLLLQDQNVEGLQFLRENQWFRAPIIPDALLINMGDQAEITSNGIFKSPVHRVMTISKKERISFAMLYLPDVDEIGPLEGLVDDSRRRLYKKIKNYIHFYYHYYQQGKSPLEAAKIQAE